MIKKAIHGNTTPIRSETRSTTAAMIARVIITMVIATPIAGAPQIDMVVNPIRES